MRHLSTSIALAGMLSCATVAAAPSDDVLRIGMSSEPTSADPQFHNVGPNNMLASHLYEGLTHLNRNFEVEPALATSYRNIDPTTWEFKLRHDVKFQDGKPFGPNDVIFSLCRVPQVPNSPGPYTGYTKSILSVQATDPFTLVIKTRQPDSILDRELAHLSIISDAAIKGQQLTFNDTGCKLSGPWPTADEFNSGKLAIGTGPFKLAEFVKGDHILLKRNDTYWGDKPIWSQVVLRPLNNSAARVAALLSGEEDLIENPPTHDIPRIRGSGKYRVFSQLSSRLIYLMMDESSDGAPAGVLGTNGKNPFKDVRVRKALSMAIDRVGIADHVMGTFAKPADQLLDTSFFGAAPGMPPLAFDADAAKKLLAEAGYPNGFEITLATPNDRYVNDAQVSQSIAQMFARIGIKANVSAMTSSVFFSKAAKHQFGIMLSGYAPVTGDASTILRAIVATPDKTKGLGVVNHGGVSDADFDKVLGQALVTMDRAKDAQLLAQATRIAMDKMLVIPLYYEKTAWAMRSEIDYRGRPDQYTRAQEVRRVAK